MSSSSSSSFILRKEDIPKVLSRAAVTGFQSDESLASGRMDAGSVEYEEVTEDFRRRPLNDRMHPSAPKIEDEERIKSWYDDRFRTIEELSRDPLYQFLVAYAATVHKRIEQIAKPIDVPRVTKESIGDWTDDISGRTRLSPEVWGNLESAIVDVKRELPDLYAKLPNDPSLVANSTVVEVRNAFARLTGILSLIAENFGATVTHLDRNYMRLLGMRRYHIRSLKDYEWNDRRKTFSPSSNRRRNIIDDILPRVPSRPPGR